MGKAESWDQEAGMTGGGWDKEEVKRQKGGKQHWNIEYRTSNIQCRSVTWCLSDFVATIYLKKQSQFARRQSGVNAFIRKDYVNLTQFRGRKNKPNF
jgi:hypothetical protein